MHNLQKNKHCRFQMLVNKGLLYLPVLPCYHILLMYATENPEIPQESQTQAGGVRQKKAPLSTLLLGRSPIPAPGLTKKSHSGPLTWNSHTHHLQVCAQEILIQAKLEAVVLGQRGKSIS